MLIPKKYIDEGEKPAIHIADRSWYYPYVEAGKDYSFDIIYRTKDWNEAARFGPIKVKATTGLGELYVANKEDIRYEIKKINDKDNHFVFTTGPVIKYGSSTIENPNFKFNIDNQNGPKPDDKWIAGPEHPGSNIDIYLPDHIGDDRKPVKIDDTLSFEMYYKEYHEDLGYFYRCQIFNHDDTKNPGLHLTSDIVVP